MAVARNAPELDFGRSDFKFGLYFNGNLISVVAHPHFDGLFGLRKGFVKDIHIEAFRLELHIVAMLYDTLTRIPEAHIYTVASYGNTERNHISVHTIFRLCGWEM